jgi:hypothetical protein
LQRKERARITGLSGLAVARRAKQLRGLRTIFRRAAAIPRAEGRQTRVRGKINFTRQFKFFKAITPLAAKIIFRFTETVLYSPHPVR